MQLGPVKSAVKKSATSKVIAKANTRSRRI
jgi:hypothetical protein